VFCWSTHREEGKVRNKAQYLQVEQANGNEYRVEQTKNKFECGNNKSGAKKVDFVWRERSGKLDYKLTNCQKMNR
jgi:hypothetical protein